MRGRHRMKATQAAIARPSATESEKEKKSVVNQPKKDLDTLDKNE